MNGFEKRALQKKAQIVRSALELLRESDPSGLRIADIAQKAGVSQVTIYNYYGSKEALLREAFRAFMQDALQNFEAYLAEEHTLKEKIEYILLQKKASHRTFDTETLRKLWSQDPEMEHYVMEEYMARGTELVVKLVEDGKKAGEISSEVSTSTIVLYLQMWSQMWISRMDEVLAYAEQRGDAETFIEEMVKLFFFGISSAGAKA
ncbi:TetR/AcrR family transcriptional regulator [Paenibacillus sp. D51F]